MSAAINSYNPRTPSRWAMENTRLQRALGITPQQYDAYRLSVGEIESGNNPNMGAGGAGRHYWGPYQFGAAATADTCRYLGENISRQQFQGNQALAERHFDALSTINHEALMRNSARYRAMTPTQRLGVLGYAHNQGAGGAATWLATGRTGHDAFGTAGTRYTNAIADGLRRIAQFVGDVVGGVVNFIGNGLAALGNAIREAFSPPQNRDPAMVGGRPTDHPYGAYSAPRHPSFSGPERGRIPDHPLVNQSRPTEAPLRTNVVVGDSIGVGMGSQYPGVRNVAQSGWNIQRSISQLHGLPRGSVADVYLGSNNGIFTPEQNRRQTEEFLRAADQAGVRINNWILPGHYPGHPRADAQLQRVADTIVQTIADYNRAHPGQRPIQTIDTRNQGIALYPNDLHLTPTGNQQLRTIIAQRDTSPTTPRPVYARADQQPIPLNGWRLRLNEPSRTA